MISVASLWLQKHDLAFLETNIIANVLCIFWKVLIEEEKEMEESKKERKNVVLPWIIS